MIRSPWVLATLALVMVAALVGVLREVGRRTPESMLESARARIAAAEAMVGTEPEVAVVRAKTFGHALRELELALSMAEQAGNVAVEQQALETRAKLHFDRGAYSLAKADYERQLERCAPGDFQLRFQLSWAELLLGNRDRAIALSEELLAEAPLKTYVQVVRARAYFEQGEDLLEEAGELLDSTLPADAAATGRKLATRIAALDPGAPIRAALAHDLGELFARDRTEERRRSLELADAAGAKWLQARRGSGDSFSSGVHADAASTLLELYYRAGRTADAIDLGMALLPHEWVRSVPFLHTLALALYDSGRAARATNVIELATTDEKQLPLDFLVNWCRILHDAGLWARLAQAAWRMAVTAEYFSDRRIELLSQASFYTGWAEKQLGNAALADKQLSAFVAGEPADPPMPDAAPRAWIALAELARGRGETDRERTALWSAVSLDADLSGEAWLRLAEIESDTSVDPFMAERSFAHALRLMPGRAKELQPRWAAAGERALLRADRDIELTRAELRGSQRWFPARDAGAWELFELARAHRAAGEPAGAIETLERLLEDYPRLVPAHDELVRLHWSLGHREDAVELAIQRLEFAGPEPESLGILREVPPEQLSSGQLLRLMRADARHSGLLSLARDRIEHDDSELALQAMTAVAPEELGPAGRMVAADAQLELGRPALAAAVLEPIPPTSPLFTRAAVVRARAAAMANDDPALDRVASSVAAATKLELGPALELAEVLLDRGRYDRAWTVLQRLDRTRETRDGDALTLLLETALVTARASEAADLIERLPVFRRDGTAELAAVLLAVQERTWFDLIPAVRTLQAADFEPTPLQEVALAALDERPDEALSLAREGLTHEPESPRWAVALAVAARLRADAAPAVPGLGPSGTEDLEQLLGAADEDTRDPRDLLAILLASESPLFRHVALVRCMDVARAAPGPLAQHLAAELLLATGARGAAAPIALGLVTERPLRPATWDLLAAVRGGFDDDPWGDAALEFDLQRRSALELGPAAPEQQALVVARAALRRGDVALAIEAARAGLRSAPGFAPLELELARALASVGPAVEAAQIYGDYCARAPAADATRAVPEFLEVLRRGGASGALPREARRAELDALALRLGSDPSVALARAQHELADAPASAVIGVGRAFAELDRFRAVNPRRSLESLRAGSARAWFEFYAELEPTRAEAFVRAELELDPTDLDLWLMLGEALEARGRPAEALEQYEDIRRMIPDPRASYRAAHILADLGGQHEKVEAWLAEPRLRLGRVDVDLEFIRARSMVASGGDLLDRGIELLEALWTRREQATGMFTPEEIGQRYATALVHRAHPADRERAAAVLDEVVPRVTDPARVDLCRALAHLAARIPEEAPTP